MPQNALTSGGWQLQSPDALNLLEKLYQKTFSEYVNGRIYRGIVT